MISENYHVSYDSNTRFIYLDPKINHKSTVIFLHEFSKFNFEFFKDFSDGLAAPLTSRIVLPQSSFIPIKKDLYLKRYSWFSYDKMVPFGLETNTGTEEEKAEWYNQDDIIKSSIKVQAIIDEEIKRFADGNTRRVFLIGYSQGAMQALSTFLTYNGVKPLGGIASLSGCIPLEQSRFRQSEWDKYVQRNTPMYLQVGKLDESSYCSYETSMRTFEYLKTEIYKGKYQSNLTIHVDPKQKHVVKGHSMQHMRDWLYIKTLKLTVDKHHDDNPDHNSGSGIHVDGDHNAEEHDHDGDDPLNPWDHDHSPDEENVPHTHDDGF